MGGDMPDGILKILLLLVPLILLLDSIYKIWKHKSAFYGVAAIFCLSAIFLIYRGILSGIFAIVLAIIFRIIGSLIVKRKESGFRIPNDLPRNTADKDELSKKLLLLMGAGISICLLLGVGTLAINYLLSPTPQTTKSELGKFTITAPVILIITEQPVEILKNEEMELHIYAGQKNDTAYFVGYSDYPEEILLQNTPENILRAGRDGLLNNNRTLIEEAEIVVEGFPALEFIIEERSAAGAITYKGRVVLVDNRVYLILIGSPKGKIRMEEMDEYLESFRLLK
jgi:hypothetical protein